MDSKFAETASCAAILGTLFYKDPSDPVCASTLAFLLAPDASGQWPFGGREAADCLESLAQAIAVDDQLANEYKDGCEDDIHDDGNSKYARESETIHQAYTRLFLGPNKLPAPPWGSVYTDHDSVIFGNKTLEVREWMRTNGVSMELESYEPQDQIGLMLLMFSWAVRNGISDEALTIFLEEHLFSWTPRFLELFEEGAIHPFYEQLARLTQLTFQDWIGRFELSPFTPHLYR